MTQQRGRCTYDLAATTYRNLARPTISDLLDCNIWGCKIGSAFDPQTTLSMQPGLDEIWKIFNGKTNFLVGMSYDLVTHKDMAGLKNNFEVIGKLRIKEKFKKDGSYGYLSTFEEIEHKFSRMNERKSIWGDVELPVKLICDL